MQKPSDWGLAAITFTHMAFGVALVMLAERRIEYIVLALAFWAVAYICGRKSER